MGSFGDFRASPSACIYVSKSSYQVDLLYVSKSSYQVDLLMPNRQKCWMTKVGVRRVNEPVKPEWKLDGARNDSRYSGIQAHLKQSILHH
jgi:hypothetical protein